MKKTICLLAGTVIAFWAVTSSAAGPSTVAEAVKSGDKAAVRALIKARADVNLADPDGTTPLLWAIQAHDRELVDLLLAARANVTTGNRYGVKPLALAATGGDASMVDALLKAGADPNTANAEGETALMSAARSGSLESVKMLLARGADVNAKERWLQETALMWAAAENHADVVKTLLEVGAAPNQTSWVTDTPILQFPKSGGPNTPFPRGGWTAAMYAARDNGIDALRVLADRGADLNVQDPEGTTALVVAIINLHYEAAALLLDRGANPNLVDITGMGPLYAAVNMNTLQWIHGRPAPALEGSVDAAALVNKLIDKGADVNARLSKPPLRRHHDFQSDRFMGDGGTPLFRAARLGDITLARILLDRGADPFLSKKDGTTSLMVAAGVALGPVRGEDPNLVKPNEEGSIEIIKLLLDRGVDINAANDVGTTALIGAVVSGQGAGNGTREKLASFLVSRGATLDARDKKGMTALDHARGGEGAKVNRAVDSGPMARLLEKLMKDAGLSTESQAQTTAAPKPAAP
jgi:ankyrin repeat protein